MGNSVVVLPVNESKYRKAHVLKKSGKYISYPSNTGDCDDSVYINNAINMASDDKTRPYFLGLGEAWERIFGKL